MTKEFTTKQLIDRIDINRQKANVLNQEINAIKLQVKHAKDKDAKAMFKQEISRRDGTLGHVNFTIREIQKELTEAIAKQVTDRVVLISKSKKGNKAQVSIRVGGKAYTRHLHRSGEDWIGNSIYPDYVPPVAYTFK